MDNVASTFTPSSCDGHTLFLVGQSCIWRARPLICCVTTRYIADRQLALATHILKARARAAGAGHCQHVAVGVEKLTRAVESHLVAVNLDVPHEPSRVSRGECATHRLRAIRARTRPILWITPE